MRIVATIVKEWQLLRKDMGGLALLFIMPVLLIIIMALVQDAPFKDFQETKFNVLMVDEDKGTVAQSIKNGLKESKHFILQETFENEIITSEKSKQLVNSGTYSIAIVIPKGVTAEVINSANRLANSIGRKLGMPNTLPQRAIRESVQIEVYFDPASKPSFKMAILNALEKYTTKVQSEIVFSRISKLSNATSDSDTTESISESLGSVAVKELSTNTQSKNTIVLNSVQHNVPAWAIFGMFFMVVIIAESIITERTNGSWTRIKLIPGNFSDIMIGVNLSYIVLGVFQFFTMLLIGVYGMPLLGLPSLQITNFPFLFLVVVCISICATSFGIFIGSFFNTTKQALPAGAISVVLLSAIGGIWVPLEVLPKVLKNISVISPLRWSLEAINNVLLRNASFATMLKPCGILILISFVFMIISGLSEKKRNHL